MPYIYIYSKYIFIACALCSISYSSSRLIMSSIHCYIFKTALYCVVLSSRSKRLRLQYNNQITYINRCREVLFIYYKHLNTQEIVLVIQTNTVLLSGMVTPKLTGVGVPVGVCVHLHLHLHLYTPIYT